MRWSGWLELEPGDPEALQFKAQFLSHKGRD